MLFLVQQASRRQIIQYYVNQIRWQAELDVQVNLDIEVRLSGVMSTARMYDMFRYGFCHSSFSIKSRIVLCEARHDKDVNLRNKHLWHYNIDCGYLL